MTADHRRPAGGLRLAALPLASMLVGCGGLPQFDRGVAPLAKFTADRGRCRGEAEVRSIAAEAQAERYDSAGAAKAAGAAFGAMLGSGVEVRRTYARCMKKAGYSRRAA